MDDLSSLRDAREDLVIGKALIEELTDIALRAPPDLMTAMESAAGLAHTCICNGIIAITAALDAQLSEKAA